MLFLANCLLRKERSEEEATAMADQAGVKRDQV